MHNKYPYLSEVLNQTSLELSEQKPVAAVDNEKQISNEKENVVGVVVEEKMMQDEEPVAGEISNHEAQHQVVKTELNDTEIELSSHSELEKQKEEKVEERVDELFLAPPPPLPPPTTTEQISIQQRACDQLVDCSRIPRPYDDHAYVLDPASLKLLLDSDTRLVDKITKSYGLLLFYFSFKHFDYFKCLPKSDRVN